MKKLKPLLAIVLIFAAGFAAGFVANRIMVRNFIHRALTEPGVIRTAIENRLTRKLDLDPNQESEVHNILLTAHEQLKSLRQQFHPAFTNVIHTARTNISTVLNPEQQKKFEELQKRDAQFFFTR